jgi:hypothetical protein
MEKKTNSRDNYRNSLGHQRKESITLNSPIIEGGGFGPESKQRNEPPTVYLDVYPSH